MDPEGSIRLGIAGVGVIGTSHARDVHEGHIPHLRLAALADANAGRMEAFPDVAQFATAEAMIASGEIDALLVATPHFSHVPICLGALRAGVHVLVEKPLAVHKAECERLLAAHDPDSGTVFAAMLNQRTDPRYRRLRELIADGTLGRIQRIHWTITDWFRPDAYYRGGDWRATWAGEGGGVLLNQSLHQLDLWQWLFGLPQRVTARCQFGRFHDIEVEDSVTALLEYDTGLQGVFATTTGEAPGTNRLEVAAENGKVVIEALDHLVLKRNEVSSIEFARTSTAPFAKPECETVEIPAAGPGPQHRGILANFAAAILGREALLAPAAEGIHSVELANAMILSTLQDRAVPLPLDGREYAATLEGLIDAAKNRKHASPRP